ncbi:MAG: acetate--CoA ligase family protein [Nitrospirae bacterium]|nr:acetate--CoA ligase family protein [Nitrospirota bacterium]
MTLDAFFNPSSIAVVGASDDPDNLAGIIFQGLKAGGFEKPVYPVNPRHATVGGVPCYPSVLDLPAKPELSVIATPAPTVPAVLREHAAAGIRHAIIVSAGFSESGEEGARLEEDVRAIARENWMRVIGPNCLGVFSPSTGIDTLFVPRDRIQRAGRGSVSVVSQSGAFMSCLIDLAAYEGIGIARAVNFGNRVDVSEIDLIDHLADDPETGVIALYLESVEEGGRFVEAASRASRKKPVIAFKAGKRGAAVAAARSHTGAIVGRYETCRAAFRKAGVIEVGTFDEFVDAAKAFAWSEPAGGRRVLVVTNGGGFGVAAADALLDRGLTLPPLPEEQEKRFKAAFPPFYTVANPFDLTGSTCDEDYGRVIGPLLSSGAYDAALVIALTGVKRVTEKMADVLALARAEGGKPVVAVSVGGAFTQYAKRFWESRRVPVYPSPERGAQVLAALAARGGIVARPARPLPSVSPFDGEEEARAVVRDVREAGRSAMLEDEAKDFVHVLGFSAPDHFVAGDVDEAVRAANTLAYPVALKVLSPDIPHKTDVGGVRTGLRTSEDVRRAYDEMMDAVARQAPDARIHGVLVEQMADPGLELIVGGIRDPQFGPVVMFGMGGVFAEVLRDVAFRLAPLAKEEALEMIREIRGAELLKGFRGSPPIDADAVAGTICRLGGLLTVFEDVAEVEFNPLLAYPEGPPTVADVRVALK